MSSTLRFAVLALGLCLVGLFGCDGERDAPSDGTVRTQVTPYLRPDYAADDFDIVDLERTNGRALDEHSYEVSFKYQLVLNHSWNAPYSESFRKNQNAQVAGTILNNNANHDMGIFGSLAVLAASADALDDARSTLPLVGVTRYGKFEAGAEFAKHDSAVFFRTEKGWQLSNPPRVAFFAPSP